MPQDFAALTRKLDGLAKEFTGAAGQKRLEKVAMQTKKDVDEAVKGDLGDTSMSGWWRRRPIPITGMYEMKGSGQFLVQPTGKGRGPMRVLESGRQAHAAGSKRKAGTRTRKKDGVTVDKVRGVKRNVGATRGKGTWSDAVELMEKRVGKRVDQVVVDAMRRHLTRG